MTRINFSLAMLLLILSPAAHAYSPEGYPGSTWGNLRREFKGLEGSATQGNVTQGIQWLNLPGQMPLVTYGIFRWRFRSQNRPYYNAFSPGAGVTVSKSFLDLGVEYNSDHFPELHQTVDDTELYLQWYKKINLTQNLGKPNILGLPVLGFPLSSWGRMTDDFNNIEGRGSQGWITQGIDWFKFPQDITFDTYATYYWRYRSENRPYYNADGPALGINLSWKTFDLELEYGWQHYPELQTTVKDYRLYLEWYFGWDLKKI